MTNKQFSQVCEYNKTPILNVIKDVFNQPTTVWEIGSGTGQHACYFASELPHINWQPTDLDENIPCINAWCDEAQLPNLKKPLPLDVTEAKWPCSGIDAIFTANTLHILSWEQVESAFKHWGTYLNPNGLVCIYGPFNYNGSYTSASNAGLDQWLKGKDPASGIKDFEALVTLAESQNLTLLKDNKMPGHNRILVFQKMVTKH